VLDQHCLSSNRDTTLHITCKKNDFRSVSLLVERGASVDILNGENKKPGEYVTSSNKRDRGTIPGFIYRTNHMIYERQPDSEFMVDPSLSMCFQKRSDLSGSAKDWQTSRETFDLDLRVILKNISQHRASKENLLAASISSLRFLSNCLRSKMENEEMLGRLFYPFWMISQEIS
jgi:hypothetical protein